MSPKDNLFIVRSPLQLINCIEAIHYFNLTNNTLVVIYNNTSNTNSQINQLKDDHLWKAQILINEKKEKSKLLVYVLLIKRLKQIPYNYVFFGDFGSIFKAILTNVSKQQIWHVDDGSSTINRYKEILSPKKINCL